MSEIIDLSYLIKNMKPTMLEGEYVFCEINKNGYDVFELDPVSVLSIGNNYTLIIPKQKAVERKIEFKTIFNMLSLSVKDNNEDGEFIAVIAGVFADQCIPAKFISAIGTHYLFVPTNKTKEAMQLLFDLTTDF